MIRRAAVVVASVLALASGAAQSQPAPDVTGGDCPVTIPNGNGPPEWPPNPRSHGNGKLWTFLTLDGIQWFDPEDWDGRGYGNKYPWLTHVREPRLTVEGRTLDPSAVPLRVDVNGPGQYHDGRLAQPISYMAATWFPYEGCWGVTARVGETSLTVVMLVKVRRG
jgi:hypothetical protein